MAWRGRERGGFALGELDYISITKLIKPGNDPAKPLALAVVFPQAWVGGGCGVSLHPLK